MSFMSWRADGGYMNQLNVKITHVSNNLQQRLSYLSPEVIRLLLHILNFPSPLLCAQIPDSGLNERLKKKKWKKKRIFRFFRQGQTALRTGLCTAPSQKQSHLLVQPVPSPFSHTPSPQPPTPSSPSTLHIVLSPVSLSVINYERHKPPGLMLRGGCLPNCTFLGSQKAAFIDKAGHTVRLPPFTGRQKSTRWALHRPREHQHFFRAYFHTATAERFSYVGPFVKYIKKYIIGDKCMSKF